jgi:hypothetical protein
VTGVVGVYFRLRYQRLEEVAASKREERIVVAPDDEYRRLLGLQILLPLRILGKVVLILIQQLDLDLVVAGTIEERLVIDPSVWIDTVRVGDTMRILELGCVGGKGCTQWLFRFCCPVLPGRRETTDYTRIPSLDIRNGVLDDEAENSLPTGPP